MHRGNCFDRYQIQHNASCHQDVDSVPALKFNAFIDNWNGNLPPELEFSNTQLICQAFFVRGFEQAWTEEPMHFDGSSNYFVGERVMLHKK